MTSALATDIQQPVPDAGKPLGWPLLGIGLLAVSWWAWTWSKVHGLVTDHVANQGELPSDAWERAGLYANGSPAEQRLSADLASMTGLYPYGRLPLVLGACLVLLGWVMVGSTKPVRVIAGIVAAALLIGVPLALFGDSARVALDILE